MATFFENLWNSIFTPGTTPTLLVATNVTFAALQVTLALLLLATQSYHFVALSTICGGLWWAINWFAAEIAQAQKAEQEASRLRKRKAASNMAEKQDPSYSADDSTETETDIGGQQVGGVQIRGGPSKIQNVLQSANSTDEDSEATGSITTRGGPGKAQAVMNSAGVNQDEDEGGYGNVRIRGGPQKILGVMKSAEDAQHERDSASSSSGFQAPIIRGGPDKILGVLGMTQEEFAAKNPLGSGSQDANKGETGSVSTDSEWEKVSDHN